MNSKPKTKYDIFHDETIKTIKQLENLQKKSKELTNQDKELQKLSIIHSDLKELKNE